MWDGNTYYIDYLSRFHTRLCSVCNGQILHSYYLYNYGIGNIYIVDERENEEIYPGYPQLVGCRISSGTRITCENSGVCSICKYNYTEELKNNHSLMTENNKIKCRVCKKEFGSMRVQETLNSDTPVTTIYIINISLINGATFDSFNQIYYYDYYFSDGSVDIINMNSNKTEISIKVSLKIKENIKTLLEDVFDIHFLVYADGRIVELKTPLLIVKPDIVEPIISNIQLSGNEWTKSKPITIIGTENWTETVNVKIENDIGRVVFEGKSNVTNNNWSISCTPEIEAGEESRTFTVTVTDACENSTTKNFNISKVDGRPPTVTSLDKATDSEWAKEKTFTFTAEDLGIGNVEIGFNDVNDYSPAVKDGNNYLKEYKFVGDAYSKVTASVYFKDGLGNITTQLVTLEKIDNTAPTITNAVLNNNVVHVTANDRHTTLGEGSGVVKYRYITSMQKLEKPQITENNSQEIGKDEMLTIPNINEVKYIYIVAEDLVGNVSESYEIEVPQLVLRSQVNQEGADGKGTILLDWTGYDITNKYFVVYRKQKDEEEWKTIVGIDAKLNNNTYTDLLGNDKEKPNTPEITIEKDLQAGQIKINQQTTDNGTTYTYYVEAYDQSTNELISKSNTN